MYFNDPKRKMKRKRKRKKVEEQKKNEVNVKRTRNRMACLRGISFAKIVTDRVSLTKIVSVLSYNLTVASSIRISDFRRSRENVFSLLNIRHESMPLEKKRVGERKREREKTSSRERRVEVVGIREAVNSTAGVPEYGETPLTGLGVKSSSITGSPIRVVA